MSPGPVSQPLAATLSDPMVVAAHLQNLIETQPVCLMRVDLDGVLLAANNAALRLLGADAHAQVLARALAERVADEHQDDWRTFLSRTWNDDSGSLECELLDLVGARRTVLLQGLAQRTSLDGVDSIVLVVQDVSARRRLESALETQAETADKLVEMTRTVEAYRVELLQLMENNIRDLEPMAAAGRVAAAVARDVQAIVAEVDARTRDLLTKSDPEADDRRDIEMVRGSFLRVASLMRQLIQATGGPAS